MRRIAKIIGTVLLVVAFVLLLGTAGSSDLNAISFEQTLMQCGIGIVVGTVGYVMTCVVDVKGEN